ncbi:hypothetical protein BJ166DRAFT_545762 [Pestalotiopsis sp. NC0098]|nr:hypothetical protein BJ166DRAFT_545762 [Pestalotiopsis sp. NC0098]
MATNSFNPTPEEPTGVLPLETLGLRAVALTTHNITWSPDAELAVGSDDSIYLYLPEFPSQGTRTKVTSLADLETRRQYYEVSLHFPAVEMRVPELNRPLFERLKQPFPEFDFNWQAGRSVVANVGSSLNHVVALEWSPNGLGRMKRSVLAVLNGGGALTVYCEDITADVGGVKIKGRNVRMMTSWVAPWSVGGNLLLPRAKYHDSPYSMEHIASFSWARDLDRNGSLLAYMNDEDEIVILSVQSRHTIVGEENNPGEWRVEEVARFDGGGPHEKGDPTDPDYMPSGSSFALRWSPWLQRPGGRTAILSYVTRHYVGFRQVTIKGTWRDFKTPEIELQPYDCSGICLHLAPDAFITWEDLVWTKGQSKECRGIIATPFTTQSFNVAFDSTVDPSTFSKHSMHDCGSTYPSDEHANHHSNPITGLVVHSPDISKSTDTPYFSLSRLSATSSNGDWYQTNLPLPADPDKGPSKPAWVTEISEMLEVKEPIPMAYRYHNPDGATKSESDGGDTNDDDEDDSMPLDDGDDESESGSEGPYFEEEEEEDGKATFVQDFEDPFEGVERVNPNRLRIWGMAASPGSGVVAVFTTLYSTIKPERWTFAGLRCRVMFGKSLAPVDTTFFSTRKLSTEARAFEWMYGGGPPVSGVGSLSGTSAQSTSKQKALREAFKHVAERAKCALCGSNLEVQAGTSRCPNGHVFANCAATGIAILAPGISNNCGVCGSKCLKPNELPSDIGDAATAAAKQISAEFCGGCGGKFLNH